MGFGSGMGEEWMSGFWEWDGEEWMSGFWEWDGGVDEWDGGRVDEWVLGVGFRIE